MQAVGRRLGFMLLWPGLFLYFLGSRRTRTMLIHDDEILLVQDSRRFFYDDKSWTLPGGGIKWGEAVDKAAAREVREELGLTIEPTELRLVSMQKSGGHGLTYQAHFMKYMCESKLQVKKLSNELRSARWFTITEAEQLPLKREAKQALALLASQR